jgi:hypothetical protein
MGIAWLPARSDGEGSRRTFVVLFTVLLAGMAGTLRAGEREIATSLPALFQSKCVRCHGAKVQKGGLDLRTFESILRGG